MLHVCGNQHCGLSNADVALGQQLFIAANLRQPGLKSCPLAGYKKKGYVCYKCLPGSME